jgi:hypothetical protein
MHLWSRSHTTTRLAAFGFETHALGGPTIHKHVHASAWYIKKPAPPSMKGLTQTCLWLLGRRRRLEERMTGARVASGSQRHLLHLRTQIGRTLHDGRTGERASRAESGHDERRHHLFVAFSFLVTHLLLKLAAPVLSPGGFVFTFFDGFCATAPLTHPG